MSTKVNRVITIIKQIIYILTPRQRVLGIFLVMLTLFSAIMQTVGVAVISPIVGLMSSPETFANGSMAHYISLVFGVSEIKQYFIVVCAITIVIYILKEATSIFHAWYNIRFTLKVERELSVKVFSSYMKKDYDFFIDYGTAKILRDIREDTSAVNNLLRCFVNLMVESITVAFILVFILLTYWQIALCIGILSAFCAALSFKVFKNIMRQSGMQGRMEYANTQKILLEAVEGIKEVQVMRKQRHFLEAFDKQIVKQQIPRGKEAISSYIPTYAIEGVFVIGMMCFLMVSAIFTDGFLYMLPILATAMVGAIRLLPSLGKISSALNYIPFYMPALESVYENVKSINEADDEEIEEQRAEDKREKRDYTLANCLELKGVCWKYPEAEKKVIDNLDLSVYKGESIGIIGQSGAGKSTLADIILGLHCPQDGEVLVDGFSIKNMPDTYSDMIGYVSQNVYLFDGSIRENIAFGIDESEIDDAQIWDVLSQAQLEKFVAELPDTINTIIGEKGVKLSGGQRQRIAIARALYRKPQILILDEATSALDNETEATLMNEIEDLHGKMTMIIIAHRLSTVRKCNRIYEISEGKATVIDKEKLRF